MFDFNGDPARRGSGGLTSGSNAGLRDRLLRAVQSSHGKSDGLLDTAILTDTGLPACRLRYVILTGGSGLFVPWL